MITRLTFGRREVQDIAILPEHVDLLNSRNGLDVQLLQGSLEFLVILSPGRLGFPHDLSPDSPLSTYLTARNKSLAQIFGPRLAQNTRFELTDPVGGSLRLQLSEFGGVHRVWCRGSGLTTGGWNFGGLGRREKRD